jgi:hypothetical protein
MSKQFPTNNLTTNGPLALKFHGRIGFGSEMTLLIFFQLMAKTVKGLGFIDLMYAKTIPYNATILVVMAVKLYRILALGSR